MRKKSLITKEISDRQANLLAEHRLEYDIHPALSFHYEYSVQEAKKLLERDPAIWLFTSKRSVWALKDLLLLSVEPEQIFTVGNQAKRELMEMGYENIHSVNISEELLPHLRPGNASPICYFHGQNSREVIPQYCKENNLPLKSFVCYKSIPNKLNINLNEYSGIWLFSPLSAQAVLNSVEIPEDFPLYAIGPVTAKFLVDQGFRKVYGCEDPSFEKLIELYLSRET